MGSDISGFRQGFDLVVVVAVCDDIVVVDNVVVGV